MVGVARFGGMIFSIWMVVSAVAAETILKVDVAATAGAPKTVTFTEAELRALGMTRLETENSYVDGMQVFEGPQIQKLIAYVGAENATRAFFEAVNDYTVEISTRELARYNPVLALTMGGEPFSPRNFGPVWLIYPMSDHAELQDPKYNGRLIWQLDEIVFK